MTGDLQSRGQPANPGLPGKLLLNGTHVCVVFLYFVAFVVRGIFHLPCCFCSCQFLLMSVIYVSYIFLRLFISPIQMWQHDGQSELFTRQK